MFFVQIFVMCVADLDFNHAQSWYTCFPLLSLVRRKNSAVASSVHVVGAELIISLGKSLGVMEGILVGSAVGEWLG